MKIKLKQFIVLLSLSLCILTQSTVVFAGADWGSLDATAQTNAKDLYAYLKLAGYSDYAAAGICGNADQEASLSAAKGSGTHLGAFQMSTDTWNSYESWCNDNSLETEDIVNQFKYVESNSLESDFNSYCKNLSLEDYKACTDIITGMEGFMVAFERCVGGDYTCQKVTPSYSSQKKYQDGDKRNQYSSSIYEALVGTAPADSGATSDGSNNTNPDSTDKDNIKQQLLASGYYTEEQLSSYIKLKETNIAEQYLTRATRDNLSQSDLENLASWEDNVNNSKKEYGFIAWLRIIVMWVGIIFTIYIFLLYLAYWFDKLNSIIDLDVLSIMTFGRLHVAIDDKEANFSLGKKQDRMTVNHKDMLFICITGLIFGTLLITGVFYKIVSNFVNMILRWIG